MQIKISELLYDLILKVLINFENHRTKVTAQNSRIWKSFIFKFINAYYALFYIAFFKEFDTFNIENFESETCSNEECILDVQMQLA